MTLSTAQDLTVVIVNWRVPEPLSRCLQAIPEALQRRGGPAAVAKVVVVDNESQPEVLRGLEKAHPGVLWIANRENRGFAAACNQGMAAFRSRHTLLLNPDTCAEPGSLACLVDWLDRHPAAAVAGPRLLNPSGGFELTCRRFPTLRYLLLDILMLSRVRVLRPLFARYYYGEWDYDGPRAVDQVSGACFLMRQSVIDQLGALDERFFVYFEEVDWCLRVRAAGFEAHYVPDSRVVHTGGAASIQAGEARTAYTHASLRAFWAKHHGRLSGMGLELLLGLDRAGRWLRRSWRRLRRHPAADGGLPPCAESSAN